jgi:predicted phage terminase large subunit-like protein
MQGARAYLILETRRAARSSLVTFSQFVEVPGKPVTEDPEEWVFAPIETGVAKHHRLIMEAAQRTMERRYGRLMVFAPPGSAKSTYCSVVAPTWYMGKYPGARVILNSYGDDLARRHGRKARQLVKQEAYAAVFGATISKDTSAADDWALSNDSHYLAAGIISSITGNRANGIIIDDPTKNREEARSETVMDKTFDEYRFSVDSRLIPGGWVILILTRWSPLDLAGRLLPDDYAQQSGVIRCKDGRDWEILCLQAKCERSDDPLGRKLGEYIWPEWFDREHWVNKENDSEVWEPLYQQRPSAEAGMFFKQEYFRYYSEAPARATLKIYGTSDYAVSEKHGDWTVHMIWGVDPDFNVYLLDYWRERTDTLVWVNVMFDLHDTWKTFQWVEEDGQIEKGLGPFIDKECQERKVFTLDRIQYSIGWGKKEQRAQSFRGLLMKGKVYYPNPATHPWVRQMERRMLQFPLLQKLDDEVDAQALMGLHIDYLMEGTRPPKPKEPQKKLPRGMVRIDLDAEAKQQHSPSKYRSVIRRPV